MNCRVEDINTEELKNNSNGVTWIPPAFSRRGGRSWVCLFFFFSHLSFLLFFLLFHTDPYEKKWETEDVEPSKCKNNCDSLAQCACGLVYGDYKCACKAGYYGTGETGQCFSKYDGLITFMNTLMIEILLIKAFGFQLSVVKPTPK